MTQVFLTSRGAAGGRTGVGGRRRSLGTLRRMARLWQLYLLVLPALVYLVLFKFWPMYGVQIAFRNYNPIDGFTGSPFVGWQHFERFFDSPQFARVLSNTLVLAVVNLLIAFPIPVVLALMVHNVRGGRLRAFVRGVLYSPTFISTVVVVGMMYVLLSPRSGLVNHVITLFGGEPILFMGSPEWFRPLFVSSTVWQESGFQMVIYLAALAGIDPALHDAARVDGASTWQRIRNVDLAGIMPTVVVLFILAVGNLMNISYEKALLMQTPLNRETSQVIQTYVYQAGLQQAQISYSAAIGLFNSVVNLALLLTFYAVVRRVRTRLEL
ncbi:ABC transporter permease [Micromonospora sp. NPDC048930]|uniref:ABC transporter permease n=1 Tax=Micromonospora sp. NPDC048930 TaxID=3364261 RepID=UPI003711F64A